MKSTAPKNEPAEFARGDGAPTPNFRFRRIGAMTARAAGAFSTLALIGVVIAGMAIVFNQRATTDQYGAGLVNSAAIATPVGEACVSGPDADMSGEPFAYIMPMLSDEFGGAALSGSRVVLQKVSIPSKSTQTAPSVPGSSTTGLEVDVVLQGVYAATFDVDVFTSGNKYAQVAYTRVPAHTPIELSHGDAVIFPYGTAPSIENSSTVASLDFLRILTVTSETLGAPPSNVTKIASSDLPNRLSSLIGGHSVQFRVYLTQFAGSSTDTTSRRLCDNANVLRVMAVQDPTAKNAKADKIIVALAWNLVG